MSSIPYSRYLFYPVTWYSFLIVVGASLAIVAACREQRRACIPKDTVIDLVLWLIPSGIIGARLYYVAFSWDHYRHDFLSVFRVWEGGIAIYGGIIAGLTVLVLFARRRGLSPLILCDIIVPGLALAQSIGRWGNWFNIEAYGLRVSENILCFFPCAVQVPADGYSWHLATFFYESVWDFIIFAFLVIFRRRFFQSKGDVFFHYIFFYAAGRMVIEELRLDSLIVSSSVRVSQLLSILLCVAVMGHYIFSSLRKHLLSYSRIGFVSVLFLFGSVPPLMHSLSWTDLHLNNPVLSVLFPCAVLLIVSLCMISFHRSSREVLNADNNF